VSVSKVTAKHRETAVGYLEWLDRSEYPFGGQFFQTEHGRMHYVDEGEGDVIVMLHGTPTWSFLYRKFIKALAKEYRCVVPDFLGFGLSDKPAHYSYKPEEQVKTLETFITGLGLKNIILILHDFGGPLGFQYAARYPDNVRKLVVMNTWMWSVKTDTIFTSVSRLAKTPLGKFLFLRLDLEARVILKQAMGDKAKLTKHIHQHYLNVFPTPESRRSTLAYAKSFIESDEFFANLWQQREAVRDIPALLLWGLKDIVFKEKDLKRLESVFRNRQVVRLEGVGHFVQEEAGEECVPIIKKFLQE
jgi:haloalkane dehalogenase